MSGCTDPSSRADETVLPELQTAVVVENLVHGTRGTFSARMTPKRLAELTAFIFHVQDDFSREVAQEHYERDYCAQEPCGCWIRIMDNSVLIRYHVIGDAGDARAMLETFSYVREDGCLGPHVASKTRRPR